MIKKITPNLQPKITPPKRKIPAKEIIITCDNGKDKITDAFIEGYPRVSIIDALRDLCLRLFTNPPKRDL